MVRAVRFADNTRSRSHPGAFVRKSASARRKAGTEAAKKGMNEPMIDIAVLGLGPVGNGVYEVITGNGLHIARSLGGEALRIRRVLDLRSFDTHPLRDAVTNDFSLIVGDPDIRVVVETMGGLHPAYDFSKAALEAGKSVVTSNKAVVEEYGRELTETAQQNGVFYLYEAAVGGGIPLISTLHGSFGANGIRRIAGILNGTTNYILTRLLDDGMAFDDALRLAQEKGYAEKDPTADVDGLDTARKICILASIASGKSIRLRDCRAIEGIRGILPAHVEAALLHGFSIKLLGVYENGTVCTAPYLVPLDSLLSATNDVFNAVSITGTAVGEVVLYGRGAGARPTASAIVSDVIEAINGTCPPVFRAEADEPGSGSIPARRFIYVDGCPDALPRNAVRTTGGGYGFIVGADADTDAFRTTPGYCEYRVLDPLDCES